MTNVLTSFVGKVIAGAFWRS